MSSDLKIMQMASAMARHAAERHRVIAENIAHADTPGYRAKDLPRFDVEQLRPSGTADGRALASERMFQAVELENVEASDNGNTVELSDQMVRSVDAQAQHEMAMAIYRKSIELLRMSMRTNP